MNKIKLLSEQLINQIAAGEVVERPASVIKELLENSVDAGAKRIVIEVENGGIKLMKIIDDGSGMNREDAAMAIERHATSKIASLEDLENVRTMGFRGEALASIASVADLKIKTRTADQDEGTEVAVKGGLELEIKPVGTPVGTEITVADLFFNTPARLKFLKTEKTEMQNITEIVLDAAIANFNVAFRLVELENGQARVVFDLPASSDELTRIRGVMGKNVSEELVEVFYGGVNLKLSGYIGKPSLSRSNKSMQYFYVNNRPIQSHVLSYAVKQAYHSLIPKERHPAFILKFELEPSLVDVNCHPRKTEVKFKDEREVFRVLTAACKKALEESVLTPKWGEQADYYQEKRPEGLFAGIETESNLVNSALSVGEAEGMMEKVAVQAGAGLAVDQANFTIQHREVLQQAVAQQEDRKLSVEQSPIFELTRQEEPVELLEKEAAVEDDFVVIGQLDKSFILVQKGEDLLIVDQHAAHERIRYQKLMAEGENQEKAIQPLLMPTNLELSQLDIAVLNANKSLLDETGVEIEHFGGNTFAINAVPSFLAGEDLEKVVLGLIDDLRQKGMTGTANKGDLFSRKEKILTYLACRSAVKFGDSLTQAEMEALIKQLLVLSEGKATCPHGRPTMIVVEKSELWSRFGRKYSGFFEKENFKDVNC